ncbi:hypothetical protein GCM10027203_53670 [Nonomuraea fastidiosa]
MRVWGAAALRGVGELVLNVVTGLAALLLVAGLAVCAVLVPVGVRGPFERVRRVAGDLAGFQAERVLGAARRVSGRRELVWLVVHAVAGPAPVVVLWAMVAALDYVFLRMRPAETSVWNTFALSVATVAIAVVVVLAVPVLRRGQALPVRYLLAGLGPRERIRELAASRAAVVDARAAELRRIERDLHDGAQAKLVAIRMQLGLARGARDVEEVRAMIDEAREVAGEALAELRDLVRGIHPPVLADRGLAGAIEASALLCPMPVEVDIDLPGRPQPPVESAVYFAAAEALTNVAKHSGASRAWVRLRYGGGVLRLVVGDDGRGGVRRDAGGGVRGIADRLSVFDGSLVVSSPEGGPTVLTMEVPCVLS